MLLARASRFGRAAAAAPGTSATLQSGRSSGQPSLTLSHRCSATIDQMASTRPNGHAP
jgi:hypothetical protein